jgi:DNA-binding PadR family transcriptional regulator
MNDLEMKTLKAWYAYFNEKNVKTYMFSFPEMHEAASVEILKKLVAEGYMVGQYLTEKAPCAENYRITKITEKGLVVIAQELKKEKGNKLGLPL